MPTSVARGWWLAAGLLAQPASVFDVSTRSFDRPVPVCDVDMNVLKGEVRHLSWAPNGESMHLQTRDPRSGDLFDYIVDLGNREVSLAFGEPAWSAEYWNRKSSLGAPGVPSLKLEVIESNRRTRPTPFSGAVNNGPAGQTLDPRNPVDAYEHEVGLWFGGEEIGNWINGAPMAGDTFGWGPDGTGALVFTDKNGRLIVIDQAHHKLVLPGVKDALFPAWSHDGTRVAWLQKTGRKKFKLLHAMLTSTR